MTSRNRNRIIQLAAMAAASLGALHAQTPAVFATGLQNPSRIIVGPNGTTLVTEAGTAANSGRVSMIDAGGNRHTLLDGLPAGAAAPDGSADGPNGLALNGRVLYIANGEGDSHVNGPKQGQIVPNPAGPSSPLFATILKVTLSNDVDKLAAGFSLQPQDHFTLIDGATVTLNNGSGDTALVTVLSSFRVDRPDPVSIYRNTHLYGLALLPSQPNNLYVVDAGDNAIWTVDLTTGRPQVLVRFANTPDPLAPAGPPFSEAVPTSVRAYGNQLLVTLLSGAPFVPGQSRMMQVDPVTGNATLFIALLASSIDSVYRVRSNGANQWFVLEYSLSSLAAPQLAPGRLLVYNTPVPQIYSDGLTTPAGLALDETGNWLYVVDRSEGKVLRVNVGS